MAWKKNMTAEEKAEYRDIKRSDMEVLFKKIDDGVKAVFESDSYRNYLKYMSKFTDYSARNCLLIMMQKPDASLVAAYGKWKQLGRTVNKGEKGIAILAPMVFRNAEKSEDENDEETTIGFKAVYVFDVSQTSGEPVPEVIHDLDGDIEPEQADAVVTALRRVTGIPIDFEEIPGGAKGYYSYGENRIVIQQGMNGVQTIKTAVHEAAHCLLHDPDKKLATLNSSRGGKETQAESIAFIVSEKFGLDTSSYSFPYIASWSQGKPLEHLKGFLNEIQEAAKTICNAIETELTALEESQKEENEETAEYSGIAM